MYGCVDAALLDFLRFCKYGVSPKGLCLTQSKVYPWVLFESMRKVNRKIIVIFYVDDFYMTGKPKYVDEMKNKLCKEFRIVKDG